MAYREVLFCGRGRVEEECDAHFQTHPRYLYSGLYVVASCLKFNKECRPVLSCVS